jgi:hypothetical protein
MAALNDWSRRQRAKEVATANYEAKGSRRASAGICDNAMSDAVAHLLQASAAVDRLSRVEPEDRSDQAASRLCEASLAIDRTLTALDEWSETVRAQSAPSGLSQSMRPDIERVLSQEIRRARLDPNRLPGRPSPG